MLAVGENSKQRLPPIALTVGCNSMQRPTPLLEFYPATTEIPFGIFTSAEPETILIFVIQNGKEENTAHVIAC